MSCDWYDTQHVGREETWIAFPTAHWEPGYTVRLYVSHLEKKKNKADEMCAWCQGRVKLALPNHLNVKALYLVYTIKEVKASGITDASKLSENVVI